MVDDLTQEEKDTVAVFNERSQEIMNLLEKITFYPSLLFSY